MGKRVTLAKNFHGHNCMAKGLARVNVWAVRGALPGSKRIRYTLLVPRSYPGSQCAVGGLKWPHYRWADAVGWLIHFPSPPFPSCLPARGGLWSSSGQGDVSRFQAARWDFWENFCLPAESGDSQLTDLLIFDHSSNSCQGHNHNAWRSSSHRETICQVGGSTERKELESLATSVAGSRRPMGRDQLSIPLEVIWSNSKPFITNAGYEQTHNCPCWLLLLTEGLVEAITSWSRG